MLKSKLPIIFAVAVFLNVAFGVYLFFRNLQPPKTAFETISQEHLATPLTDSHGKSFSFSQLKGQVWVIDFIFTTCGSICPVMTKNLSGVFNIYRDYSNLHFVSVSVNPDFDTPEVLTKYAQKNKIDTSRWHFLTGPREVIQDLAVGAFKIGSVEEPIFHSPSFVLVDKNGTIRGYYEGTNALSVQSLINDLAVLLRS